MTEEEEYEQAWAEKCWTCAGLDKESHTCDCGAQWGNHEIFLFDVLPEDIASSELRATLAEQWETSPSRVAHYHRPDMGVLVQVHEPPYASEYQVCMAIPMNKHGQYQWVCIPVKPRDPCTQKFMEEISQ